MDQWMVEIGKSVGHGNTMLIPIKHGGVLSYVSFRNYDTISSETNPTKDTSIPFFV
jgi:alpha-tubulin suppressor-like RCC1 family protein